MKHKSVAIPNTIEILTLTRVNPLISKCKIKVCYVGDEPNRNKSIITEDVARELANSLPGSPIVGYFNSDKGDFEGHNEIITIKNGVLSIGSETVPYGFIDLNARVWFEEYLDDFEDRRKYLCTEGYLWTGQYPEARTILEDAGKPQSMELDQDNGTLDAFWTKDGNGNNQFFIINEAVISKLCVLGDAVEPCFEGASVTGENTNYTISNFSIDEGFKQTMFSLIQDMKNILEGGQTTMTDVLDNQTQVQEPVEPEVVEPVVDNGAVDPVNGGTEPAPAQDPAGSTDFEQEPDNNGGNPEGGEPNNEPDNKYNLEEVVEYQELLAKYEALEGQHNELTANYATMEAELNSLKDYQATVEKERKEKLINSFSMLTDEDKEDVVTNIMTYSYDEIKSKLAVICVDKQVSFANNDTNVDSAPITFNLNGAGSQGVEIPGWLKAVKSHK